MTKEGERCCDLVKSPTVYRSCVRNSNDDTA